MSSRRGYLSQEELTEFADITIIDPTEADDQISQAEELIDAYVGFQDSFIPGKLQGLISAGGSNNFTLESDHINIYFKNYFRGCWIEIMGGTGEGQRGKITGQTYAGVITLETAFTTPLDTTSFYRIYQLGKFPRCKDIQYDSLHDPTQYYKIIPEAVRRAVAAQVQYFIEMGSAFFSTDKTSLSSESIGDYSYSMSATANSGSINRMIAPKARELLKGIHNRTGRLVA